MSFVWRKIQQSNKKATKFCFTATFQELSVTCSEKWQPQRLFIAWVHRRRRVVTKIKCWEPSIVDPYRGVIVWPQQMPEFLEIATTLYRNTRSDHFNNKEWTFIVEEALSNGRSLPLAAVRINLRHFTHHLPGVLCEVKLKLRPLHSQVRQCLLKVELTSCILDKGSTLDADLQSEASMISQSPSFLRILDGNGDIANFSDINNKFQMNNEKITSEMTQVVNEIINWKEERRRNSKEIIFSPPPSSVEKSGVLGKNSIENSKFNFLSTNSCEPKNDSALYTSPPCSSLFGKNKEIDSGLEWDDNKSSFLDRKPALNEIEDLLSWSQMVTENYQAVKISDFSKSWRNGLGFCAIIHYFRPDLIGEYERLDFSDSGLAIRDNCRKALDAAALLGIPKYAKSEALKLLDMDDMVIMKVPDKVAVSTFVHDLRTVLTGHKSPLEAPDFDKECQLKDDRFSFMGLSTAEADIMDEIQEMKQKREKLDAIDFRDEPLQADGKTNIKYEAVAKLNTSNNVADFGDAKHSMKHSEFDLDTDEYDGDGRTVENSPPLLMDLDKGIKKFSYESRKELKLRARQLLNSRLTQNINPEYIFEGEKDDFGSRSLQKGTRKLMKISDNGSSSAKSHSVPSTVYSTPVHQKCEESGISSEIFSGNLLKTLDAFSPTMQFYQFKKVESSPILRIKTHESPVLPPLGRSQDRINVLLGRSKTQNLAPETTFDRFRRFGSMKRQDLTETIGTLHLRLAQGVKNSHLSKDNIDLKSSKILPEFSINSPVENFKTRKITTKWEKDLSSNNKLHASQQEVALRLDDLYKKGELIEKRMRETEANSENEETLLNEHLRLLNEKDVLIRKEQYFNIVENIQEIENKFTSVQEELGILMKIEENDKTEAHKKEIDNLMSELVTLINKKDELSQQLIITEAEFEEAEEGNRKPCNFVRGIQQPQSASKRLISWLRS